MKLIFEHHWKAVYRNAQGVIEWIEEVDNLVPTQMLNSILNGAGYSLTYYVGLVENAGFAAFAAADTAASHAGWTENVDYNEAVRQTLVRSTSTAAAWSNAAGLAVFTMVGTGTIRGLFMQSSSVKSGTAGVLGGEVAFSGGNRAYTPAGTITVSVSGTAASA